MDESESLNIQEGLPVRGRPVAAIVGKDAMMPFEGAFDEPEAWASLLRDFREDGAGGSLGEWPDYKADSGGKKKKATKKDKKKKKKKKKKSTSSDEL